MEERDQWEDIIRSKLQNYEVDTDPGDWQAIQSRLPGRKVVFSRRWYYAAAAIAMFLMMSIGYYYVNKAPSNSPERGGFVADVQENKEAPSNSPEGGGFLPESTDYPTRISQPRGQVLAENMTVASTQKGIDIALLPVSQKTRIDVKSSFSVKETLLTLNHIFKRTGQPIQIEDYSLIADATPTATNKKSRWGFGAGGGSYSVGTNGGGFSSDIRLRSDMYSNSANSQKNNGEWYLESPVKRDDYFNELLTSTSNTTERLTSIQKVGVSHKQPISLGLGVSYALSDRWSLQSGLVYTFLSSEWSTVLDTQGKFKQHLHFVGIPLGIGYKIAEWNKVRFYATSGGMMEWNVAGNITSDSYFIEERTFKPVKDPVRMKEMQWSVNARVGASYPLIRFVNAYVEGGANYYFDTKSSIETIRSDKPFHVSLQAGLRFGF